MKKIYIFLSLCLITITNFAQTTFTNTDNVKYEILDADAKTAQVVQYDNKPTGAITILDKVTINSEEYTVTSIESPDDYWDAAFNNCTDLTSVTLPNSVTSIGDYAFYECTSLTSVTLPNSMASIGNYAFASCRGLTSITIPASVTSIGDGAFQMCSNLKNFVIPESVTSISKNTFKFCSKLESISIPEDVTFIGDYAFDDCAVLTSVTLSNSVTSIGDYAFTSCTGFTTFTIPNSVTSIGHSTFARCSNLTNVTIPESVTSISREAFALCSSLTSVTIPDSVTSIGDYTFYDCTSLTSVTSLAETPADISGYNNVFNNIGASPELIIPSGSKTNYDNNGWSSFFNKVTEANSLSNNTNTIEDLKLFTNNGEVKANLINIYLEVYTVTGKKVANSNLKKGFYIVVAKNQEGKTHTQKVVLQ